MFVIIVNDTKSVFSKMRNYIRVKFHYFITYEKILDDAVLRSLGRSFVVYLFIFYSPL